MVNHLKFKSCLFFIFLFSRILYSQQDDIRNLVDHHYVTNNEVKIHYVTLGNGPLVLFVHGFPDFWYTWRDQMEELSGNYKVAAVDLRGYNLSDSPEGVENYTYSILVNDLVSVINNLDEDSVFVVAHDWGAGISWRLAIQHPELVKKLIILSIPHPKSGDVVPEIPIEERKPSYADYFVSDEFKEQLTESWFSGWVRGAEAKQVYIDAFRKSDKNAMINYYRANFPTLENLRKESFSNRNKDLKNLEMPVLIIHGKKDKFSPTNGHNNTWNFVDNELTIEILPEAGHFVQQDESQKVTELLAEFLMKK